MTWYSRFRRLRCKGPAQYDPAFGVIALLRDRTTLIEAQGALARGRLSLRSLHDASVDPVKAPLLLVVFAVAAILLLACCNIANMLGARWSNCQQEFAIRQAVGATRVHIAVQLYIEVLLLAFAGAAVGIGAAYLSLQELESRFRSIFPSRVTPVIDGSVLLFALMVVIFSAFLSASLPILSLRTHVSRSVLDSAGRGRGIGGVIRLAEFWSF